MKIGFALPQVGPFCDPAVIAAAARRGEELGYTSAWVNDRVLWPTVPRAPYPASADSALPEQWQRNLDPLDVLTFAAAHTTTLRLGTSVLVLPFYNPILLARRLTTVDVLSNGRLVAGFGLGWSPDEYRAARVPMAGQASRLEDSLDVIEKIWAGGAVEHESPFVTLAESVFDTRPVQRPRPPVYLAAYTPAGLARIARRADGWIPAGVPISAVQGMRQAISQIATDAGRDPADIGCVVRANMHIADGLPDGAERPPFCGTLHQVMTDVEQCAEIGVDEVLIEVQFSPDVTRPEHFFDHLERFAALIAQTVSARRLGPPIGCRSAQRGRARRDRQRSRDSPRGARDRRGDVDGDRTRRTAAAWQEMNGEQGCHPSMLAGAASPEHGDTSTAVDAFSRGNAAVRPVSSPLGISPDRAPDGVRGGLSLRTARREVGARTGSEASVARLVAEGPTNREVVGHPPSSCRRTPSAVIRAFNFGLWLRGRNICPRLSVGGRGRDPGLPGR